MQKIKCPKCNKIMGGCSSTSKNNAKHLYYKCASCGMRITEKRIEKPLMKFLNDMLDFFLIIDNSFKPSLNKDTEKDIKKYQKIESDLKIKETRIKKAFVDGLIEPTTLQKELNEIEKDINKTKNKIIELEKIKENIDTKQDAEIIFNLKEIEKIKLKSNYVKEHNLWNKLSPEQKQFLFNKYIDEIEIDIDKNYDVSILNITFNKSEIENIGYMFRNDCFDIIVNIEDRDLIISNYKNEEETTNYINNLRNFYNVKEIELTGDLFDINDYDKDNIIQIIPQEKTNKFEKNEFKILQIGA